MINRVTTNLHLGGPVRTVVRAATGLLLLGTATLGVASCGPSGPAAAPKPATPRPTTTAQAAAASTSSSPVVVPDDLVGLPLHAVELKLEDLGFTYVHLSDAQNDIIECDGNTMPVAAECDDLTVIGSADSGQSLDPITPIPLVIAYAISAAPSTPSAPSTSATPDNGTIGDGTWVVGTDIQAGTWHTDGPGAGDPVCHWTRESNLDGEPSSVIATGASQDGPDSVAVLGGDKAFTLSGGCTWTRVGD
jgi:hypothetical protein